MTSYVKIWGWLTEALFCKECFPPNQKFLRLPVPKLWLKRWFAWFVMCLTLTLTFQGHLIFLNSPFVPLHDWCKFWSDIFLNNGDIAHWNMEKLPILYNGNFRCHGNVCYVFRINPFFCKLHRIGPSHMCVNFEKNRLRIEDFRKSEKIVFFLWRDVARKRDGDLDLDLYPIFTQKFCQGPWNWIHQLSKFQKDRAIGVACTSFNYGQTDRQMKGHSESAYFAKLDLQTEWFTL